MVKTRVATREDGGGGLLNHIDRRYKVARLTDQKLARFKSKLNIPADFLAEFQETATEFFAQLFYIGFNIIFSVGQFKTASKVDKMKIGKLFGRIEQNLRSSLLLGRTCFWSRWRTLLH